MRRSTMLWLLPVFAMTLTLAANQDHGASADRAASAMGFDQARTTHHFSLFNDGGAIDVRVDDPADATNQNAIRMHLHHIAAMFGDGHFEAPMLVHDSKNVPGTSVMARLKAHIHYSYSEVPGGGRVNIVTQDPDSLEAVHQFLRFQIEEHKTGDSTAVRSR